MGTFQKVYYWEDTGSLTNDISNFLIEEGVISERRQDVEIKVTILVTKSN